MNGTTIHLLLSQKGAVLLMQCLEGDIRNMETDSRHTADILILNGIISQIKYQLEEYGR